MSSTVHCTYPLPHGSHEWHAAATLYSLDGGVVYSCSHWCPLKAARHALVDAARDHLRSYDEGIGYTGDDVEVIDTETALAWHERAWLDADDELNEWWTNPPTSV